MSSYRAYGLAIHSTLPFPELVAGNGEPDLLIRQGRVEGISAEENGGNRCFSGTAEEIQLFWRSVGRFLVRMGQEIVVDPALAVPERLLRSLILGPLLGLALHQRGLTVLHASAVSLQSSAVAFLGLKGQGKSTLAAALCARGHRFLADDITALDAGRAGLVVEPAFPQVKLWPDSIEALGDNPQAHPALHPLVEKRACHLAAATVESPVPLRCVYILGAGPGVEIIRLAPKEALLSVLPHWYGALFGGELLPLLGPERQFRDCVSLVQQIPVYLLKRPPSLAALPEVAQMIERHFWGGEAAGGEGRETQGRETEGREPTTGR